MRQPEGSVKVARITAGFRYPPPWPERRCGMGRQRWCAMVVPVSKNKASVLGDGTALKGGKQDKSSCLLPGPKHGIRSRQPSAYP